MAMTTKIFIRLLEEGSPAAQGTEAIDMGNGLYKILPTPTYDPEDEIWEFIPGSIVRCTKTLDARDNEILLAVEKVR